MMAGTALALCACANPYADQLARLDARYAAGKISRKEYIAERDYLAVEKAQRARAVPAIMNVLNCFFIMSRWSLGSG